MLHAHTVSAFSTTTARAAPPSRPEPVDPQRRRQALLSHRRSRSVSLGPCMWLQFEDELTVQHQLEELSRQAPCGDSPDARQREIDAYAHLLPDGRQWKATLLLGLPDAQTCDRALPELQDAARHLYVQLPKLPRVYARPNEALACGQTGAAASVHFLRFEFPAPLHVALLAGAPASLGCAHDRYAYRRVIPLAMLEQLRCDLAHTPR